METIRHILDMKGDFIFSIGPNESVFDALRLMANKDIGALLVMENDSLVGIISERDYARKIILLGRTSRQTKVKEIMSFPVHTIHPDQVIEEALIMMNSKQIRHLPVSEDGIHVLGVISVKDVLRDMIYYQRESIKTLEDCVDRQHTAIRDLEETLGMKYEHRNRVERLVP
jgi:signal-transduction protein with cAMP-binding, CBS, and nucleotidyltransferase domain